MTKLKPRHAVFDLGLDKMIYIRSVEHDSGHHEMFALCQRREDGLFDARVRCRRPPDGSSGTVFEKSHGVHYMTRSHEFPEGTTRDEAIAWVIATSTKGIPVMGAMNPITSDKSYEFEDYDIDDMENIIEQMKKSDIFDMKVVPNRGTKETPHP